MALFCSWNAHLLSVCKEDLARQEVLGAHLAAQATSGVPPEPQMLQASSLRLDAPQPSFWFTENWQLGFHVRQRSHGPFCSHVKHALASLHLLAACLFNFSLVRA